MEPMQFFFLIYACLNELTLCKYLDENTKKLHDDFHHIVTQFATKYP